MIALSTSPASGPYFRLGVVLSVTSVASHWVRMDCRVEERRGGKRWGQFRLPSPLIKPDVRISRIRLSDWVRCEAHGGNPAAELRGSHKLHHEEIVGFRGLVPYAAD